MPWLLKTEPSEYSFDRLVREGRAVWDGVSNALALKHMRAMAVGDRCFVYHTGDERRVVGVAEVTRAAYPRGGDAKDTVVELRAVGPTARAVTLDELKAEPALAGWDLLRISRLSVVPTSEAQWAVVEKLAASPAAGETGASAGRTNKALPKKAKIATGKKAATAVKSKVAKKAKAPAAVAGKAKPKRAGRKP